MFDSTPRLVLGIVAACVALSVLALLWSRQPSEDNEPKPGSVGMRVATAKPSRPGQAGADSWAPVEGQSAPPQPRKLTQTGEHTVPSEGGRRLALEKLPERGEDTPRRAGVVQYGGNPAAGAANGVEAAPTPPVSGTTLALPLTGSAHSADDAAPIEEENIYYDPTEGAFFAPDARLAFPDKGGVNDQESTIAFWIKPDWNGTDPTDNSFVQLRTGSWENRIGVFKNGPFLRFLFTDNTGIENNVGIDIRGWQAGDWHHIGATWANSVTTLYVDGTQRGQGNYQGQLEIPNNTPMHIGSDLPNGTPGANAVIRSFYVVDRALSPDEMMNLYDAGVTN